jgi:hypothetical protein
MSDWWRDKYCLDISPENRHKDRLSLSERTWNSLGDDNDNLPKCLRYKPIPGEHLGWNPVSMPIDWNQCWIVSRLPNLPHRSCFGAMCVYATYRLQRDIHREYRELEEISPGSAICSTFCWLILESENGTAIAFLRQSFRWYTRLWSGQTTIPVVCYFVRQ